jgi:hypothetical protein
MSSDIDKDGGNSKFIRVRLLICSRLEHSGRDVAIAVSFVLGINLTIATT